MIKPQITLSNYGSIIPFDATKDYTFYFTANGSSQITQNQIIICNSLDNSVIFNETLTSFQLQHLVPLNKLQNGNSYTIKVRTGNNTGEWSEYSNLVPFKCLSTPIISITNIINNTVNNQTFSFQASYSQTEGEQLQSYKFYLYDEDSNLIASSLETLYSQDISLTHEFSGMENGSKYYIEFVATTIDNIQISTSKIEFTVSYITPRFSASLTLENKSEQGGVQIYAEVIQIIGKSSGIISYINNEEVDLTKGMIDWQENFSIENNFTLKIWSRNIIQNIPYVNLYSPQGKIQLIFDGIMIHCYITMNNITTHMISNSITVNSENDIVFVFLQKNNEYVDIKAQVN
jgi:hypothetical protein